MTSRPCDLCGNPLPEDAHGSQKYHPACRKIAKREKARESNRRRYLKNKYLEQNPRRLFGPHYNPMRGLGMDYVTLKLAGKIKPLHKRRRQITLHGF